MVKAARDPAAQLPLTPACFLILLAFARGVRYGYAVMNEVEQITRGWTTLGPGTLYRTIQRMLLDGLISEGADESGEDDERRRHYELTDFGRRVAVLEAERHADLLQAAIDAELLAPGRLIATSDPSKRSAR
jgi:DNA-binding PadR family transcriptional regulator